MFEKTVACAVVSYSHGSERERAARYLYHFIIILVKLEMTPKLC